MPDAKVLEARLTLLQEDAKTLLQGLLSIEDHVQRLPGPHVELGPKLKDEVRQHRDAIGRLLEKLVEDSGAKAWTRYHGIRDDITKINHEILEIVGSLALRENQEEAKYCWIVQRFMSVISGDGPRLTVFTARDLYSPRLARLTRVRFPVRAIWSLPLAAYQFANLMIDEETGGLKELADFRDKNALREVDNTHPADHKLSPEAEVKAAGARRKAMGNARGRWTQLIADALAVYYAGPCYAGSSIMMRLSPAADQLDDESQASEVDRAFVVIEMLRQMDLQRNPSPYGAFIAWLETRWSEIMDAYQGQVPVQERQQELRNFVTELKEIADYNPSPSGYAVDTDVDIPTRGSWSRAQVWAKAWEVEKQLQYKPLDIEKYVGDVRDAFNAGWLCWSKTGNQRFLEIGGFVRDLCIGMVEPPKNQGIVQPAGPPATRSR